MKLLKKVSNVLNITFNGDYSGRAGVTFRKNRRNAQVSVMVGSVVYSNVYGIITDKLSNTDMKSIANNMANIANIGKLISTEMKNTQVKPHGKWFVTSHTVRTQVVYKNKIYNAVYSKDTGKQIGKLKLIPSSEVKPASIPALRNKKDSAKAKDLSTDLKTVVSNIDKLNNRIDNIHINKMTNPNITDERLKELYDEVDKLEKEKRNWELSLEGFDLV